jgi:DNA-binding response OmpR family regulator
MRITTTGVLDRPVPAPRRSRRVLLVEDDPSVRRAVARALRTSGFDVTAVADGEQVLSVLTAVRPDVLVTDVSMPGMDGLEVVRTLRVRGVQVPALVVSARDEVTDRAAAFDAGADAFLAKPFGLPALLSRVTELARQPAAS